jgi:hypothetical protein
MAQSTGKNGKAITMIAAMVRNERVKATRKRTRIFGTSRKKFERSTSFFVAPHVMLYENKWARIALLRWMERPPKKIRLEGDISTH